MRALHGMEAFFRGAEAPPPAWKMAVVTWIGVMPAVYIFSNAVPAVFGTVPELVSLVLVGCTTPTATAPRTALDEPARKYDGYGRFHRSIYPAF